MNLKEIIAQLLLERTNLDVIDRPFIVGIDGLGGAGKTTFVNEMEKGLTNQDCQLVVLHIDDYIVRKNKRYNTGHEEWFEYYYLQWDIKLLAKVFFEKMHQDFRNVSLPLYNNKTDSISLKSTNIRPNSIVLIEGVFLQRIEWRDFFDFVIFIECSRKLRMERVLNRDAYIGNQKERLSKYQRRYWLGEEHYLKTENPIEKADAIYNAIS
ncbi:kinase [Ornithinibacillus xuwenensis]|uniref:Kinase n=1 Tax=Ornithinibacillus xuwenensis TaxID=3144668 RepID=A0ABU9XCX0_9BACI